MVLARWQGTIVDDTGDIVPNASVEVRDETPGQPLVSLFSDRDGTIGITNPFTANAEGFAAFHVIGGSYQVRATSGSFERVWRYVDIGTARSVDIDALSGDITFPKFIPDAVVDTIAERNAFENETRGFSVVVNNDPITSPPSPHVYFLVTPGTPGVWSEAIPFTSGTGDALGSLYGIVSEPMANVLAQWEARTSEGTVRPRATRRAILDDLLGDLQDAGTLAKLDFLYIFAGHDRQNVLFDMVDPTRAIAGDVGGLTFNADQGFTGNGVDGVITYPFASTTLTNFTQNAAHIGCYTLLELAEDNISILGNDGNVYLRPRDSGVINVRLNATAIATSDPVPSSIGHTVVRRSNATEVDFFKNGVFINTAISASEAPSATTWNTFRFISAFSVQQVAAVHGGDTLTDDDITALYLGLTAYLQEVGAIS